MARDDRPAPRAELARDAPPPQVRAAGLLVGVEALAAAVFTVALVLRAGATDLGTGAVLGEAGFFLLVALTVGAIGAGLVRGRRWARTPALVLQLLLLPVVYSLLGPSHQVLLGLVCGVLVFATFMLLVHERSRLWSMDLGPDGPG